ncbi:uncharacterized protein LOC143512753 [Brachyhypopomus gauderio]|uniref:uncharacterized protein LOC143512753 n=1 Tax=Brachyhypopomus gauderio TaxID=698409 RepID=UPI004040FA6A
MPLEIKSDMVSQEGQTDPKTMVSMEKEASSGSLQLGAKLQRRRILLPRDLLLLSLPSTEMTKGFFHVLEFGAESVGAQGLFPASYLWSVISSSQRAQDAVLQLWRTDSQGSVTGSFAVRGGYGDRGMRSWMFKISHVYLFRLQCHSATWNQ